jgi:glycosyltransferase involved in cell wall biosynthesis
MGGAERQILQLLRVLDPAEFDISLFTLYRGGDLAEQLNCLPHIRVVSLDKTGRWDILAFGLRLVKQLRGQRPHVLHSYGTVPNLLAAAIQGFVPGARLVWGIRCSYVDFSSYDWFCRLQSRIEGLIAHRANLIIVNSYAGLRHYSARGYPKERMVVVPNGIDNALFHPNQEARQRIRAAWGIGEGEILVGIVGRIDPIKDHKTFLESAARLHAIQPLVRFVVVGDGPAPYVEQLRRLAEQLQLTGRILWTGKHSNMVDIYNSLDICCSSSVGEGFSNSIAEALSCGVPCVVTDVGDSAKLVGDAGIAVPPGNLSALSAALLEMIHRLASSRAQLSRTARSQILPFGLRELSERTTMALRQIL